MAGTDWPWTQCSLLAVRLGVVVVRVIQRNDERLFLWQRNTRACRRCPRAGRRVFWNGREERFAASGGAWSACAYGCRCLRLCIRLAAGPARAARGG